LAVEDVRAVNGHVAVADCVHDRVPPGKSMSSNPGHCRGPT
jgi:hypothetical protein